MTVKTKKLLIRIISISLAILMVVSVFASAIVGYADEIPTSPYSDTEEYSWVHDDTENIWKPVKKDNFNGVIFQLSGMSDTFTQLEVKAFIANVATKEIFPVTFTATANYVAAVPLEKGYYFLTANNYAWADESGLAKCINNNEPIFFKYNVEAPEFWGYSYNDASDTQIVYFGQDISSCKKTVSANASLILSTDDNQYPLDMLTYEVFTYNDGDIEKTFTEIANSEVAPKNADKEAFISSIGDLALNQNSSDNNQSVYEEIQTEDPTLLPGIDDSEYEDDYNYEKDSEFEGLELVEDEKVDKPEKEQKPILEPVEKKTLFQSVFIDHIGLWIVFIGTGIAYFIVKQKKQKNIENQLSKDKYDDTHVD